VLSAPNSDATLSQEVQQALTDENGYLQGISSTLTTPVGNSAATLQPLATSAQSALVPLASVAPGASNSLSGTSNLISWSNGAASAATRAHDAAQQQAVQQAASNGAQHGSANSASSSAGSSSSSAGGASTGLTSCDQNISAGADTSCPLAENTFYVFSQSPEQSGETISVYSPTSGNTYALTCTVNGLVDCAGQASTVLIQFPFQAALDYTPAQAAAYAASAQLGDSNPNG
jgi:hypothetical protein